MCFCLGTAIAEIVSAYPTNGGLYSASAYLVPRKYRSIVGWVVGWLNLLGQCAGVASTEFGLAQMIFSAVTLSTGGTFVAGTGAVYGLFLGLLCIHGALNSLATKWLARLTQYFVFINLGTVLAVVIALLVTTEDKHPASYIFTSTINGSGWSSEGLVFLLGLLSVQWTMTDYDATAHISEEVRRASYAAPVAIFIAVLGTGAVGWVYNIVYVMCSGDIAQYDGSIYAPAQVSNLRLKFLAAKTDCRDLSDHLQQRWTSRLLRSVDRCLHDRIPRRSNRHASQRSHFPRLLS